MRGRRACVWVTAAVALCAATPVFAERSAEITASSTDELIEALRPPSGARTIRLRAGRYTLDAPLRIPDGVELLGEGVMRHDSDGLPAGFAAGTETALVASEHLQGDVVALGDGARLEGLRIEGPRQPADSEGQATGNVVLIASRRPGDHVRAVLRECEIVNHSTAGIGPVLPTGRAIVVLTVNPGAGTLPHDGARVGAQIHSSVVRNTSESDSVFAINFASAGTIELDVEGNRLEGTFGAAGGVGRPHRVSSSRALVRSRGNLYVYSAGSHSVGWVFLGASVAPHAEIQSRGAESSSVRVESQDDRIAGYRIGILAAAGRLVNDRPGSVVGNRAELSLSRLAVRTAGDGAEDLSLHGALHFRDPGTPSETEASTRLADNVLRVSIRDSSGSGARSNRYAHASLSGAEDAPHRNRLEFAGSRAAFLESNTGFDPAPDPGLFDSP